MRVTEASSWHNERERTEKEQAKRQLWKRQAGGWGVVRVRVRVR